jgi:hypothetical protein
MDSTRLSSAVWHAGSATILRLSVRFHRLSLPSSPVTLTKLKTTSADEIKNPCCVFSSPSPSFLPCPHYPADSFTKCLACRPSSFIHQNQILPGIIWLPSKTLECLYLVESPISSPIFTILTSTQA